MLVPVHTVVAGVWIEIAAALPEGPLVLVVYSRSSRAAAVAVAVAAVGHGCMSRTLSDHMPHAVVAVVVVAVEVGLSVVVLSSHTCPPPPVDTLHSFVAIALVDG